jgi:Raf kinase inhibitor-like YbhB/YbcL family protein
MQACKQWAWWLVFLVVAAGCGGDDNDNAMGPSSNTTQLVLTSTAFNAGGMIPAQYRCTGANVSPPLAWSGGPQAQSYALILEDPDAAGGTFAHWVLYSIPGTTRSLPENASPNGPLPAGTQQGNNDFPALRNRYFGPCPPAGDSHRYFFRLFALSGALNLPDGATAAEVRQAMQGRELAQTELMGNSPR